MIQVKEIIILNKRIKNLTIILLNIHKEIVDLNQKVILEVIQDLNRKGKLDFFYQYK